MHCSVNNHWLFAKILHYINFTTGRPASRRQVAAKQPEPRPESLTGGKFDSGFKASVEKTKMTVGVYANGSILARTIPTLIPCRIISAGLKHQVALAVLVDILVACIVFQLVMR